ncbi:MAG: hypothetical protein M1118_08815, partial [Chloroflexi bacterium]|nr:hypothetical protein [Chloroflexota bacterium]
MTNEPQPDYTPLDLTPLCNADLSALPTGDHAPIGAQQFHGLPFLIGSSARKGPCFLLLGGADRQTRQVAVGRPAHCIIFVHRLLESQLQANGPPGELVATYVLHLASGEQVRLPIRERFEIATVPPGWGQQPFRAWPDQEERLWPRYEGRWGLAGSRQTEGWSSNARGYFLWPWLSPDPTGIIEAIEIVPEGPRFLLAAITPGHLPEHPFTRSGSRYVRLLLPQPEDAHHPFALSVTVDRGSAG